MSLGKILTLVIYNYSLYVYIILNDDAGEALKIFDKIENKGGRKLIGTGTVSVLPAIKTPVDITASLAVKSRYDFETVKSSITAFLEDYFEVGNYDFNTELSIPSLSAEVMNPENAIEGIRFFKITSPVDDVLVPSEGVIYTLGTLTITDGGA